MFDTELKKMNVSAERGEKVWKGAIKLLNGECPEERCEWCEKV